MERHTGVKGLFGCIRDLDKNKPSAFPPFALFRLFLLGVQLRLQH